MPMKVPAGAYNYRMIIGITGSIGSGKTTTANLFKKYGFEAINADDIGHKIIKKNSTAYKKIVEEFGNGILGRNRDIDRNKLGDIVFKDKKKLKKLNSITHPLILKAIKNLIEKIERSKNRKNVVIDAPLLLEAGAKDFVDKIVVVKADDNTIIKRLAKKYPKNKIENILKSQMPLNEKLKFADYVIDNSGTLKETERQVENFIRIHKSLNLSTKSPKSSLSFGSGLFAIIA